MILSNIFWTVPMMVENHHRNSPLGKNQHEPRITEHLILFPLIREFI